jgi:hypothetical protein
LSMQSVLYQLAGAKQTFATLARAACFDFDVINGASARLDFLDDFPISDAFANTDVHTAIVC